MPSKHAKLSGVVIMAKLLKFKKVELEIYTYTSPGELISLKVDIS